MKVLFLILLCPVFFSGFSVFASSILDYKIIREDCDEFIAIRSMQIQNQKYKLIVHKEKVKTFLVLEEEVKCQPGVRPLKDSSAFERTLMRQTDGPYLLANHGLKSYQNGGLGQVISVDLCPSSNAFNRELFERLIVSATLKPVPVSVAITALWLRRHTKELEWLKQQELSGQLKITWVNHSETHPYYPGVGLENNFLLSAGVNFDAEVLNNEKTMIENGLTPSVFFRFPGLVSSEAQIRRLREMSLVPVGSLAWLAKGERADLRSLVLVHGNGNEPAGIDKILGLIQQKTIFPRSLEAYSIFGQ